MCGIMGLVSLRRQPIPRLEAKLEGMQRLLRHRGPDGAGLWVSDDRSVGLAHTRLAIIDLSDDGRQPMAAPDGGMISFNGEIYNYLELRETYGSRWSFRTQSDTECILAAHERQGDDAVTELRGMFAYAYWRDGRLFCARDRFGMKPFYYTVQDDCFIFASEVKALLPFLPEIETDPAALSEYLLFQYAVSEQTLFKGVQRLLPAECLVVADGTITRRSYWRSHCEHDFTNTKADCAARLRTLMDDSVRVHLRSDVDVGGYLSGGVDSSLIMILANRLSHRHRLGFHGRFSRYDGFDEHGYAASVAEDYDIELLARDLDYPDFTEVFSKIVYHMDYPEAGPGAFPQYMTSQLAAQNVKVALSGLGGDEIFAGYARYLLAYFEQTIKGAIEGTHHSAPYVVTPASIIPNLRALETYKPLIKKFWSKGLFESIDRRYLQLIDRSVELGDEILWDELDLESVRERCRSEFDAGIHQTAFLDKMCRFDMRYQLPALLHVEDRMSMAHSLESRLPFLDHPLIEFMTTVPAIVKFENGDLKHLLKYAFADTLPQAILSRRDKMGFPVPLNHWFRGPLRDYINDTFSTMQARNRPFVNAAAVKRNLEQAGPYSRSTWALLSLEVWHQTFHDRAAERRALVA